MIKDEEPLREIDKDHGMLLIVQGFFDQPTSAAGISKTKVKQAVKPRGIQDETQQHDDVNRV